MYKKIKDKKTGKFIRTLKRKKCKNCGKEFMPYRSFQKHCGFDCYREQMKIDRIGKKNPAYRNGTRINNKDSRTFKHRNACRRYRKKFIEKNDYLFCEKCKISSAMKYEVHHIVYASEKPMHKELHNDRNLILLCIGCHNDMHGNKKIRNDLVEERNLNELFECELKR